MIHFKLRKVSLIKSIAPGGYLPLSNRLDKCKFQIKVGDGTEKAGILRPVGDLKQNDNKWSSLIPLSVLKYRLDFNEGSFLSTGKSEFTFLRKVKADQRKGTVDICLMVPMLIKNRLPLKMEMNFIDSSD